MKHPLRTFMLIAGITSAIVIGSGSSVQRGTAHAASNDGDKHYTIHISSENTIDTGAPGSSIGDIVVIHDTLTNTTNQTPEGTASGTCIVTVKDAEFLCNANFLLPDGEIAAQGTLTASDKTDNMVITGGTLAYDGIRGVIAMTPIKGSPSLYDLEVKNIQ